ncbi:hypothetical protein QJS04_geneDACA023933 [Acorus gramineus]|uniref:Uncharacterized protein n=1 Tax=Acorus gramineus TaxID=55184 RepID=A0AAV8ZY06_ACOGR|nr:hypothetical protein QJS04_geneDACA023933 [Acorus gramineus]
MYPSVSTAHSKYHFSKFPAIPFPSKSNHGTFTFHSQIRFQAGASPNGSDAPPATIEEPLKERQSTSEGDAVRPSAAPPVDKNLKKIVQKTAATFAPRASTKSKNPAVPGTALYTVFEVQGYASMLLGGALSFNLIFPSNEPDIWRLMGMWSIWMFSK